jgi:hypothetical protein
LDDAYRELVAVAVPVVVIVIEPQLPDALGVRRGVEHRLAV